MDLFKEKKVYWVCYNIASVLCFGFWPQGRWDLSSPTRDQTCNPCIGRLNLNHWTAREVPNQPPLLDDLDFIFKKSLQKMLQQRTFYTHTKTLEQEYL